METFGFEQAIVRLEKIASNTSKVNDVIVKEAEAIKEDAKSIAISKGLKVTGAGVDGIVAKHNNLESLIGWAGRPNLHLYFHEVGWHAGFSKYTSRGRTGKRIRRYKKGSRKYKPPNPHVRPAAQKHKDPFARKVKEALLDT